MDKLKEFIRITDAAGLLGVDYKTVYRLIRQGRLPASKPGGIYLIRTDDVHRLLDQGRIESPTTGKVSVHDTLRCGYCLRVIERDTEMGGVCLYGGCEEVLCTTCWHADGENMCHRHSPTREQRYEVARRALVAGQISTLVSAREARQKELAIIGRFDQKVQQIASLKNPLTGAVYKNLAWESIHSASDSSAEVMSLLNTGFLDTETMATLPINLRSVYTVASRGSGLTLDAYAVSRLDRYIADGFDTNPLGLDEMIGLFTEVVRDTEKTGYVHVLGLASPTGWSQDAVDYVASAELGKAYSHRLLLPYLVDTSSGRVFRNMQDTRTAPLASLFSVLMPEEEVQEAMRVVRNALLRHNSLTLTQAMTETGTAEEVARQAFERLVGTGSYVAVDVPGMGLAITRR